MDKQLNYTFKRRSQSFLEWFYETIKSEKYFTADAMINIEKTFSKN